MSDSESVIAFIISAREYCAYVRAAPVTDKTQRITSMQRHLAALYTAALALPAAKPSRREDGQADAPPAEWRDFGDREVYWTIYDPYGEAEPVAGALSDDVIEVFQDISRGLSLWDAGLEPEAVWEWRFGFETHWGKHAIDALRALHDAGGRG